MFGGIASTLDGPVTLHFPCGFKPPPPDPPANCQVVDANNRLLFTVHRAGAEKQPAFSFKPIRKPTIVRAAGAVVGMFCSDQEKAPTRPGTSYSGYSKVPRFEGQAPTSTCEGVPMFKQWSGTKDCKETLIFYYGPAGLEKPMRISTRCIHTWGHHRKSSPPPSAPARTRRASPTAPSLEELTTSKSPRGHGRGRGGADGFRARRKESSSRV